MLFLERLMVSGFSSRPTALFLRPVLTFMVWRIASAPLKRKNQENRTTPQPLTNRADTPQHGSGVWWAGNHQMVADALPFNVIPQEKTTAVNFI